MGPSWDDPGILGTRHYRSPTMELILDTVYRVRLGRVRLGSGLIGIEQASVTKGTIYSIQDANLAASPTAP